MGHIKYGPPPTTRKWKQVANLIAAGAGAEQLATATLNAATGGLKAAANDRGVVETYWLLVRIPLAARMPMFAPALRECGIQVNDEPGLLDIVVGFCDAVDATMPNGCGRTDAAEMAQMAAIETLNDTPSIKAQSLFGTGHVEVRNAFASLATQKRFGVFARPFFTRFAFKCLSYLLSKSLPQHVGEGQRFRTLAEQERFLDVLQLHCHEATTHHARFAGDWFHLHRFQTVGDITRDETQRFFGHAMTKLTSEFRRREE